MRVTLHTKFLDSSCGGDRLCGTCKVFLYRQTASSSFTTVTYGKKSLVNNEPMLLKCV